jgi:hypothetical protein
MTAPAQTIAAICSGFPARAAEPQLDQRHVAAASIDDRL